MPTIKYDLSLTKFLEIGVIIASLAVAWGKFDGRLTQIEYRLNELHHQQSGYVRAEVQVERDARVLDALTGIDKRLARIEGKIR